MDENSFVARIQRLPVDLVHGLMRLLHIVILRQGKMRIYMQHPSITNHAHIVKINPVGLPILL